ncbi:3-methyladenine DNA glycosylase, partial [Clavibacter californiensis]
MTPAADLAPSAATVPATGAEARDLPEVLDAAAWRA